ncbi:MAG: tetratricopeptide repeat protein [Acetobacterales bacterium]
MRRLLMILALLAAAPAAALAAGSGSSWDSGSTPENSNFIAGRKAAEAGDYRKAIGELEKVVATSPRNADAHNLLGFSHRKLGNSDKAMQHYQTALSADPDHKGANEYLGELYLQMGEVAKAEERLARLDRICLLGCAEYTELKKAIAAYKGRQGASRSN